MWMDAYVQQILIRQQMAECERAAAVKRALRETERPRPRRRWRPVIARFVRSAIASSRRPAERVAVR